MVNRAVVGLLVLTAAVQILILYRQLHSAPVAPPAVKAVEPIAERGLKVSVQGAPRLGALSARVAIAEFADFECPFCRRHASTVFPLLKKQFIDTGVVAYYYFHFPLKSHPHAADAAKAAECARTQGHFWEMHDLLVGGIDPASLTPKAIRKQASSLAIDFGAFDRCIATEPAQIAEDVQQAAKLDIASTPIFMLGTLEDGNAIRLSTRINGAQPLDVFAKAIDELSRRSSAAHSVGEPTVSSTNESRRACVETGCDRVTEDSL